MKKKLVGRYFIVFREDPIPLPATLRIQVNHQVKGAVRRNRVKRVVREFFRGRGVKPRGSTKVAGLICQARPAAGKVANDELFKDLNKLFT